MVLIGQSAVAEISAGFMVGDPTAISVRKDISETSFYDSALGWSSSEFHLHASYLRNQQKSLRIEEARFDLYYGLGLRLKGIEGGKNDGELSVGPRIPVGVNYSFDEAPIDVFTEIALNLQLAPETEFDVDFAIGARYRF
jgi:hypothetical protein